MKKTLVSNGPEVEQSNLQLVKLFSVFDFDRNVFVQLNKILILLKFKKIEDKKTSSETRKK